MNARKQGGEKARAAIVAHCRTLVHTCQVPGPQTLADEFVEEHRAVLDAGAEGAVVGAIVAFAEDWRLGRNALDGLLGVLWLRRELSVAAWSEAAERLGASATTRTP